MQRYRGTLVILGLVLLAILMAWGQRFGNSQNEDPVRPPATRAADPGRGPADCADGELPADAVVVVETIEDGGPFRYRQDGTVFRNDERLLPPEARGFYREYTVRTPGSADRGARRVVAGRDGIEYYTDDHYGSFCTIDEAVGR